MTKINKKQLHLLETIEILEYDQLLLEIKLQNIKEHIKIFKEKLTKLKEKKK